MNRNFDYMRLELSHVIKNQEQIMDSMGLKPQRFSVIETLKETPRLKEELKRKNGLLDPRTIRNLQKNPTVINRQEIDIPNLSKESNIFF